MRTFLFSALAAALLCLPAFAQDSTPPDGVWVTIDDMESADLAVRGWGFVGTTALNAGSGNGLLVTFWRDANGNIARCIFSLVSPTGSETFETCSVAATVNRDSE